MSAEAFSYLLYLDDDAIPIDGSMTLGNHLENDVIVPGEDVLDFHLRLEMRNRGPVAIPLGNATVSVNGTEIVDEQPLMLGDVIGIGQVTAQIGVEIEVSADVDSWWLEASNENLRYRIEAEVSVGRSDSQDIILRDEHISRQHARFIEKQGYVWLQDLGSANGCWVNGERIVGGIALFHGDFIRFDALEFQLIGEGDELTPIKNFADALSPTARPAPMFRHDTTEIAAIDADQVTPKPIQPDLQGVGAFLLAASDDLPEEVYQLHIGDSTLGRGEHNQIVIPDATVSASHAKISVRPEAVTITNLLATNGTRVNGSDVTSLQLTDGDVIRLGRVCFIYKEIPPANIESHPIFGKVLLGIMAGIVAGAALLLYLSWG